MSLPLYYKRLAIQIKNDLVAEAERSDWERRNTATGEQYCIHGCNVGTWDGPDLMCGYCESDWSIYDYALDRAHKMWRRDRQRVGMNIRNALLHPEDGDLPPVADVLSNKEFMVVLSTSIFLTGDLKRGIKTIDDALEALT